MDIAIDTNIYSNLGRGKLDSKTTQIITTADTISLSAVVIAELYGGFYNGNLVEDNIKRLYRFITQEGVKVLHTTLKTCEMFGKVYSNLKRKGTPIPTNDIWIASHCIEHGLTLLTSDNHFSEVEGLDVILGTPTL